MNELEFSFEESPWELYLDTVAPGGTVSALRLLTLMEGASEEALEDALLTVQERGMSLDISQLPQFSGSGELARQLRKESQFAQGGMDLNLLEKTDPLRLYLEEVAAIPACGDENILADRTAAGDVGAAEQLTNLGLSRVISLAGKFAGYGLPMLDLIQEGSLGLWQGIQDYSGGDYLAFRDRHIHMALAKAVTVQARASGIGAKLRTAMQDYRSVDERLLYELGRNPTAEEMAEGLHMTLEETCALEKMLEDARILAQVKKAPDPEEEEEAENQAVEDTARFQSRQRILDILSAVSPEDAQILSLRFGLDNGVPLSPEQTGRKLGLTAQEVTAREAAALNLLRRREGSVKRN